MEIMINKIISLIFCHLIGDYVLQGDYIAKTKATNFYHLIVHCALYCVPFFLIFGTNLQLESLFISHMAIDLAKCKSQINYVTDQILHFIVVFLLYFLPEILR